MASRIWGVGLLAALLLPGMALGMDKASAGRTYSYHMQVNDNTLFCIDIKGGKAKPGSVVQLYRCHNFLDNSKLNQRWEYTGLHELIGQGGICLDGYDQGGGEGAVLRMQLCNGTPFQKWTFEYLPNARDPMRPETVIKNAKGLCIGVKDGTMQNGTPLVMTNCQRKKWVTWTQLRAGSVDVVACAKRVRQLNDKYLKGIGGVNDYEADKACERNDADIFKTFMEYVDMALHKERNQIYEAASKELKR